MTISRRGFLAGMFAACAAPAIVRAENMMKIYVPPQEIIILDSGRGLTEPIIPVDESAYFHNLGADFDGDTICVNDFIPTTSRGRLMHINRYPLVNNGIAFKDRSDGRYITEIMKNLQRSRFKAI